MLEKSLNSCKNFKRLVKISFHVILIQENHIKICITDVRIQIHKKLCEKPCENPFSHRNCMRNRVRLWFHYVRITLFKRKSHEKKDRPRENHISRDFVWDRVRFLRKGIFKTNVWIDVTGIKTHLIGNIQLHTYKKN